MRDDSQAGVPGGASYGDEQIAAELFAELETVDTGLFETLDNPVGIFRFANDAQSATRDRWQRVRRCFFRRQADLPAEEIPRPAHSPAVEPLLERRLPVVRIAEVINTRDAMGEKHFAVPLPVMNMRVDQAGKNELAASINRFNRAGCVRGSRGDLCNHPIANENLRVLDWDAAGPVDERSSADQKRLCM